MKLLKMLSVISIILVSANFIFADDYTLIERTLESSFYKSLDVKTISGEIKINVWDKQAVNVLIKGNQTALKIIEYAIDGKDGNIFVTTKVKTEESNNTEGLQLRIEITVPKYFNADLKTMGGDIKVNNLVGAIKVETAGGDIKITDYTGESNLKTMGGDIKANNFKGNITANTLGGEISLDGADGEIKAETAGGDIKIKYKGNNSGMTVKTMGGNIKLTLPETFKAMLDITSTGGEIKSDCSLLINKEQTGQTMKGEINGGGNIIKCTTMGGKISVYK